MFFKPAKTSLAIGFALLVVPYTTALPRIIPRDGTQILQANDDGWAHANIRALYQTLRNAGFNAVVSAPANNLSGAGSLDFPPIPLVTDGEFGTILAGAPAIGTNATDPRLNYVNSFPVTSIKYGISTFASKFFSGPPDLVVTGPNAGSNLGLVNEVSGTVGAANEGLKQGIPSIAFSGAVDTSRSYTELVPGDYSFVYAELALKVINEVLASGKPYLPANVGLNVNFPTSDATTCTTSDAFKFVLSRVNTDINPFTPDVQQCGTNHLPTESDVIASGNCAASISVFAKNTKLDVSADLQGQVRDKLASILSCL